MPRRKSNLGRRTRGAEAVRRVIAKQTEEERALANERNRQRMAQIRAKETAEQRAARLEDARWRARRARSAASDLLRSQQNERDRLRMAERRRRERLRAQLLLDYNRLAFQCKPADDVAKYQPAKALQQHEACSKKISEQPCKSNTLDRTFQK